MFLSKYTAEGTGEIGFSSSLPGKVLDIELDPGESIIAQKGAFICGTYGVELSTHFQKKIGAGLAGGEGFIIQKITGSGTVFLEIDGHCVDFYLGVGEQIVLDTGVLAVMDDTCSMDIETVKGVKNVFFGGEGLLDIIVTGPGKVYLQTMTIKHLADLIIPFIPTKNG